MTDRLAVTTKRVTQNFSLEDASLLCSSIEQWQKAHEIGINQDIDWPEVNFLLNKKLEVYGRSFTSDECRECWKFLAYGAALPAFGQQKDSWIFQNSTYLHPKPAVEKFNEAVNKCNMISVISTDESSQGASESGDMKDAELKSQSHSISSFGDKSCGPLILPDATAQSNSNDQQDEATNPLDIVCSKAKELYPPMVEGVPRMHSISPLPSGNESKGLKKMATKKVEKGSELVMMGFLDNNSEIAKAVVKPIVIGATSTAQEQNTPTNAPATSHAPSLTSLLTKKKGRPSSGSRSPSPRDETTYSNSSSPTSSFSSSESSSQDSKPFASISAGELLYMAITGKYKHGKTKVATVKPKAKPALATKEKAEVPIAVPLAAVPVTSSAVKAIVEGKLASPKKELKRKAAEAKAEASSTTSRSGSGSGSMSAEPAAAKPAAKKRKQNVTPKAAASTASVVAGNPFRAPAMVLSLPGQAPAVGAECVGLHTLLEAISTVHSHPKTTTAAMPPAMTAAMTSAMTSAMAMSTVMSPAMYVPPAPQQQQQPLQVQAAMAAQMPAAYYMTAPPMPVYGMESFRHLLAPTSMAAISGSLPQMHMLMNSCAPMQSVHGHMQNMPMQSMPMQSMPMQSMPMQSMPMPPMPSMAAMSSMQGMQPMLPIQQQQKLQMQGYPEAL